LRGDDEFAAWFRLLEAPGLGRATARRLLAACGSPEGVFRAPRATLQQLVGPALTDALLQASPELTKRLALAQDWRHGGSDRHVLALGDADYPAALMQAADPPLMLYVRGELARLAARSLAIVGTRHPSPQGTQNAHAFATHFSQQGWVVVSGLAQGIDGAAHEGALEGAAGTVAVLGTGLDLIYPRAHQVLAERIAAHGALVSEFPPGTPALPLHFPQRNRIIAGLTQGTLVVEAALKSGSLITARLALEAGREVFAVPGSIHAPQSKGCHALIKQGAKLVENAQDVLDELGGTRPLPLSAPVGDTRETDPLLAALGHDPTTLDALQARTGMATSVLNARLLELEFEGRLNRLPGGLFQRCARA
jgi:DNA processing protein